MSQTPLEQETSSNTYVVVPQRPESAEFDTTISLREIVIKLLRGWWIIIIAIALALLVATWWMKKSPPLYYAKMVVAPVGEASGDSLRSQASNLMKAIILMLKEIAGTLLMTFPLKKAKIKMNFFIWNKNYLK